MSVHLHIERLVLDGLDLDRFEARRLHVAIERMLAARFGEPALQARLQAPSPRAFETRAQQRARARPIALAPLERGAAQIAERVVAQVSAHGAAPRAQR